MPIIELPDGRELEFPDGMSQDQMAAAITKSFPEFAPKAPERSWGDAANDTARQLGEGVNTILGAVPNLVAPEGKVAKFFNDNANFWRGQQSAPLKARIARADTAINAAGEEGIIAQVVEAANQYSDDPALAARFVTTNLPSMIPGIGAAKVAQAAALARGASAARAAAIATTAAGGANATLNAGGARGEAFEDIKRAAKGAGMTDAQAEQRAIEDSRLPAAVGAATGFISGKTGLEGAIAGRAGAGGALRRGVASAVTEMAGEQLEEVAPKLATNWEARALDGRDVGQDVGRTMVETAIGAGPGAVVGGVSAARNQPAAPEQRHAPVEPTLDTPAPPAAPRQPAADVGDILTAGSVDDAINAAISATRAPIAGDTPTPADIDNLEDTYADIIQPDAPGLPAVDGMGPSSGDAGQAAPGLVEALADAGSAAVSTVAATAVPGLGDAAAISGADQAADAQPALTGDPVVQFGNEKTPAPNGRNPVTDLYDLAGDQEAMQQSQGGGIRSLRGNGDQGTSGLGTQLRDIPAGRGGEAEQGAYVGQAGFQAGVSAWQRSLGDSGRAGAEPQQQRILDVQRKDAGGQGLGERDRSQAAGTLQSAEGRLDRGARTDEAAGKVDDWSAFPSETGTLNVPRSDMPQIKAAHRGALVNFLAARGITHQQAEIDAADLKPTQAEFSLAKVRQAQDYQGGNRSILVSSDGHVLDGHHQWMAAAAEGRTVPAIVLDAPIAQLLDTVREFPSATVDTASAAPATADPAPAPVPAQPAPSSSVPADSKLAKRRALNERQDELVRAAAASLEARKKTGGSVARDRMAKENPFLHFLAEKGLLLDERSDTGGQKGRAGNRMIPGFGPVYRRNGKRLDELAALAVEAGFLTQQDVDAADDTGGTRKLAEMIQRAVHGNEVIARAASIEDTVPGADEQLMAEAARLGLDTEGKSADQVYDEVAAMHAAEFSRAEAEFIADADLDAGATSNLENDEELDAVFGPQSRGARAGAGQTQEGAAVPARGRGQEAEGAREGQDELLTSYSAADVVARQDADAARQQADKDERARADQQRKKDAERRDVAARMDASAENFQLGQSADDSLSGQSGLRFSVAADPAPVPPGEDALADIPRAFQKKVVVQSDVWSEAKGRYEQQDVTADVALRAIDQDIQNMEAMLKCMRG